MLAQFNRSHRSDCMAVVRNGHDHRLDVLLLFKHDTEILVLGGFGKVFALTGATIPVNVAQASDVLAFDSLNVFGTTHPGANHSNVKLLARRSLTRAAQ